MKNQTLLALIVLVLALSACGGASPAAAPAPAQSVAEAPAAPPSANSGLDAAKGGEGGPTAAQEPAQNTPSDTQRLVIKTAQLSLQVESVRDTEIAIRNKVNELGGYIVTSQSNGTDADMYMDITFRVPSNRFEDALNGVQGMAKKVLSRSLGGEDVTAEYVDLESRMRNLEATRDRLLTLLQKADKVEDALAVNQALTDVQGQIEQAKGRMEYLQKSSALSTISVSLRPVPQTPIISEDGWEPLRVARQALRGLIEFGQGLVELAIILLVWAPVWLPIILLLRWGWRRMARKSKPIEVAKPIEPQAPTTP
ncbi:MAG: DUF4349 domain-containing protein [Roseiflexaceae bacterium]|nr:DUF4349 domain-containing protein [Roseiflexaceae bacterium]